MADNPKILGQHEGTTSWHDIYTTPTFASSTAVGGGPSLRGQMAQTVVTSLVVCETGASTATFSVAVQEATSGSVATKEYLFKATALTAKQTHVISPGITLAPGNVVKVKADSGAVTFNLFGTEVT